MKAKENIGHFSTGSLRTYFGVRKSRIKAILLTVGALSVAALCGGRSEDVAALKGSFGIAQSETIAVLLVSYLCLRFAARVLGCLTAVVRLVLLLMIVLSIVC